MNRLLSYWLAPLIGTLDPKSSTKPLTKANTRPSGTDEHQRSLSGPIAATVSSTKRFAGECWGWA